MTTTLEKLSFIAEYFDPQPQIVKKYLLRYYPESNEVDLKDVNTGRKFLSRSKIGPSLSIKDFVIGGRVVIFSRDMELVDYGDNETRYFMLPSSETCTVFLSPQAVKYVENIISHCESRMLTLVNLKSFTVNDEEVSVVADLLQIEPEAIRCAATNNMNKCAGYCIFMEFRGEHAIDILGQIEYDANCGVIIPSNYEQVHTFKMFFVEKKWKCSIAKYKNNDNQEYCCCVVKPHAIKSYLAGEIMSDIKSRGFEITALQVFCMDRNRATEFYEVYKGIKEYHGEELILFIFCFIIMIILHDSDCSRIIVSSTRNIHSTDMIDEIISGPVLAMEIACSVNEFRAHVGPWDVDVAQKLHPTSIRAKFGKNTIQNALHCTDLREEANNELSYFFDILSEE